MTSGIEWGLWIAICTLIVGAAKFADEYHIRKEVRSRTRDMLSSAFLYLDHPKIVNFPSRLYEYFSSALRKTGKFGLVILILIAYFAITASFYNARRYIGDSPSVGYIEYSLTWISSVYWAFVMLWGICVGAVSFIALGAFVERWNNKEGLIGQWIIAILALILTAIIALGSAAGFFVLGSLNPESGLPGIVSGSGVLLTGNPIFLGVLSAICLWHAVVINALMVILTAVRTLYVITHKGVLSVLNAASDPKVSPFQYFATMIALFTMTLKVFKEVYN